MSRRLCRSRNKADFFASGEELEASDAADDQADAGDPDGRRGLLEENHAQDRRADGADAGTCCRSVSATGP